MPLLVAEQRSPEWYAARQGRVTASLAAACLNVGPEGPLAAFNAITGRSKKAISQAMYHGIHHEADGRAVYEASQGVLVWETGFWVHPTLAWLGASPDGLVGRDGLLEVKCPRTIPEAIPPHHLIQCQVQLAVCERPWCDYICWTSEGFTVFPRIMRDCKVEALLLARLKVFYDDHVVKDVPPPRMRSKQ